MQLWSYSDYAHNVYYVKYDIWDCRHPGYGGALSLLNQSLDELLAALGLNWFLCLAVGYYQGFSKQAV
jgi:hypothetical protein